MGDIIQPPMLHNLDGGWAAAADGVKSGMDQVERLGGVIIGGKKARNVLREGGKVVGIVFEDESVIKADVIILATGSWTASSFEELGLEKHIFASG